MLRDRRLDAGKPSGGRGLRPAHGCIRLSDADMKMLIARLAPTLAIEKVRLVVSERD